MAYGLDVPIIIAAAVALALGTVVVLILLLRGPAKKPAAGKKDTKKSSSTSAKKPAAAKKPTTTSSTPKTEKKKAEKPKAEKKKAEKDNKKPEAAKPKKVEKPVAAVTAAQPSTSETSAAGPESPKTETGAPALTKTEKKKQARKAAAKVVEVPEETSAEDIEFARAMSSNAKGGIGGKKKEVEAEEAEVPEQTGSSRDWAHINAKNSEVQKYKAKLKESEKEVADLRRIIDDNKKKMRDYNLTNAKLVTEKNTQKEAFEEKITRLKADIEARRENRDVAVKGGDTLRDRNYVVNVLQQERDTYKNQCADLQAAIGELRQEFQKLSEGDNEKLVKGLQQQLEAVSLEHNKVIKALQDAKQAEALAVEKLQAERVNVARLTNLLESSSASAGKEHAAAVEDTNGKEGDEQAST